LVRFDGNSFAVLDKNSTPALPGNDVRCLLETKDGALWIGTSDGLARWKDGVVTAFTTPEGLPGDGIRALVESANGGLWVWTDGGLARQDWERFLAITAADGLPSGGITAVTADGVGSLWVATTEGMVRYRNGRWTRPGLEALLPRDGVALICALPLHELGDSLKSIEQYALAVASKSTLVLLLNGYVAEHR
jgi:ligand-binding sensor domain-containing protein